MRSTQARHSGLALAATLFVAAASLIAAPAASALAPGLNSDNRLGDITFDKSEGEISWAGGPQRLTTETGCPEGYRNSSRVYFIWSDGTWATGATTFAALIHIAANDVTGSGLAGEPIDRQNASPTGSGSRFASQWNGAGFPAANFNGHSGTATYVITCDPGAAPTNSAPSNGTGVGQAKFFSADVNLVWNDATKTGTWSLVEGGGEDPGPEKTATTTTLTASTTGPTSATLTATLSPEEASGTVTFKRNGTNVGSAPVTDGHASLAVSGLQPSSTYSFTADYSGDDTFASSTSSAVPVTTEALPADQVSTSPMTVNVPEATSGEPSEPTGLKISTKPGAVTLAGSDERTEGQPWTATGTLGNVTVNDDRQDPGAGAWTLNGRSSAFTSGSNTIAASNLGWTPSKVSGAGTAGGTATDLSQEKSLASGTASADENVQTTVKAGLSLVVPAAAPEGSYTATLTLTLI